LQTLRDPRLVREQTMSEVSRKSTDGSRIGSWFQVEIQSKESSCTLILSGALCGTSIAALEAQVDQFGATRCDQVVIDVHGLPELDAVGASVLLGLYHYVAGKGGEMHIVGATGPVASTLHATPVPSPRFSRTS
jgi:anti-anti-sigma factor